MFGASIPYASGATKRVTNFRTFFEELLFGGLLQLPASSLLDCLHGVLRKVKLLSDDAVGLLSKREFQYLVLLLGELCGIFQGSQFFAKPELL